MVVMLVVMGVAVVSLTLSGNNTEDFPLTLRLVPWYTAVTAVTGSLQPSGPTPRTPVEAPICFQT